MIKTTLFIMSTYHHQFIFIYFSICTLKDYGKLILIFIFRVVGADFTGNCIFILHIEATTTGHQTEKSLQTKS